MAILVKHNKVSSVPDTADTSLVRPSDWNADHTLTGFGTAAEKDAGVPNGVATLDAGGKVPVSELPAAVLGALSYQGTWNASTNTPTLTSSTGTKGYYYVVSVAGSTNLNGITDWLIGDWAVYNGTVWQKVDNTETVTSVNGQTGAVTLTYTDVGAFPSTSTTGTGNVVLATGATQANPTISNYEDFTANAAPTYTEGRVWYDSTAKALAYFNDVPSAVVHIGHDLQLRVINNTGSTIANGSPVYITGTSSGQTYPNVALAKADVAATSAVIGLTDGSIANGAIGYVTSSGVIDGVNTGSFTVGQVLYLSPYSAGQLMNTLPPTGITVQVGVVTFVNSSTGKIYVKQTTPLAVPASIITGILPVANGGTGAATLTGYVKGSGTSAMTASGTIPTTDLSGTVTNAQLANSAITINGTSTSLGGSISVGTVTSVDATAGTGISVSGGPITGSGSITVTNTAPDQTVVLTAGTGISTSGTYPNFTITNTAPSSGGTVTSVGGTGTVNGISLSGTVTSSGNLTLGGTLSGVDLTTQVTGTLPVANGGTGLTSLTANRVPYGNGTSALGNEADFTYDPSLNTVTAPQVAASNGIFVNSATVTASYSIPSGSNAMSAGVITIANGITVTIPNGNNWIIV
jgi:hypothetical protein